MKRLTLPLLIVFCCCSCSRQTVQVQSTGIVGERDGTITIRSTGYGKNKGKAISAAEQNAIELLLFRGIPGSQQALPLVAINETSAKSQHEQYFRELLDNRRHKSFILSSIPVSNYAKRDNAEKNITVDVRINLPALRTDLESHGVIRKFGY